MKRGFAILAAAHAVHGQGPTQSYDCAMKQLALDYAHQLQPFRSAQDFQNIADALNGSPQYGTYNCGVKAPTGAPSALLPYSSHATTLPAKPLPSSSAAAFYIDPVSGNDSTGDGTIGRPFQTIARGVEAARAAGPSDASLILRQGTHFLASTINLGIADSGLSFQAYPGEKPWISGGVPLTGLTWTPYNTSGGLNIWQAVLAPGAVPAGGIPGLRYNGARLIRARYPNANPETDWFGSGLTPNWLAPDPFGPTTTWVSNVTRNDTVNTVAQTFTLGYNVTGGGCPYYSPPAGYFCGDSTTFGGTNGMPQWPKGAGVNQGLLPHTPYWTNLTGSAVVHAFRANHWFTRMHSVASYSFDPANLTNQSLLFDYGKGGFQGAEGTTGDAEFYVENVFEELDAPGEWFFNSTTRTLYLYWNASSGTAPPSADGSFIATQQKVFFNIQGSQTEPVTGVSFTGLGFRDQAITYFEPHGLPSGGDWAIQRTGALFLEGTVETTITSCSFDRMDGITVFLSGYNRGVNISYNDFNWSGETVIALWGYGDGGPVPGMGPDLRAGNQPRYTTISYNIAREIGIWQKQSSFVFQAVAGLSTIVGNIYYNGPRAGINFNDGSLGGSNITGNLAFNFCRESGDHGVFNSWDRLPYLQELQGYDSTTKLWDVISYNFWVANYECMAAIDNDDVSGWYQAHHNFFSYSPFGLKADFGGHSNRHYANVYGYLAETSWFDGPAGIWDTWGQQTAGHELAFYSNHLIQDVCHNGPWPGQAYECNSNFTIGLTCYPPPDGLTATIMANNTYYLPIAPGQEGTIQECGMPLAQYQASCPQCDPGSTVQPYPDDSMIMALAKAALGMA